MYRENYKFKILISLLILLLINNIADSQSINDIQNKIPDSVKIKLENHNIKEKVKILITESRKYINKSNNINFQLSKLAKIYAEKQKDKEIKGLSYKNYGVSYFSIEKYDSAIFYYNKALKLLKMTFNIQEVSNILYNIGYTYLKMGLYEKSIDFYHQSIEEEKPLNNIESIAWTNDAIGQNYFLLGKYNEAFKYYNLALEALENTNSLTLGRVYNNIGLLYKKMGEYNEALKFYNKALKLYKTKNSEYNISKTLNNIGAIYDNNFHQYKEAFKYYNKALKIKRKIGNKYSIAITLNNLAGLSAKLNNYHDALLKYNESLNIFKEINSQDGLILSYNNLGHLYLSAKKYNLAHENFIKSLKISKKLNYREYILDNYKSLAELFFETNMYEFAYNYFIKYDSVKDSIFNNNIRNKIAELEAKIHAKEKQEKLKLLEIENAKQKEVIHTNKIYFFSAFFILILILIIFYFVTANKRLKNIQKNSELKQKLYRLQMNPHFIFNSLIAIQGYIYQNNIKLAGEYLSKYSKLIRLILNYSNNNYCLLEKEIELTKYYIDLQLLRFNNNFDFSFDIDKNINIENIKIPPMLIQPFVENSIEHGIKNLTDRRGKIKIKIEFNDKTLCYKIEDNGIGFEMAKNIEASMKTSDYEKQSLAVSITKDRLKLLGKKKYKESRLNIIQKKNEKGEVNGVLVKICVPYII